MKNLWHVQVFETNENHLKDVTVEAASEKEAIAKAHAKVLAGKKFYAQKFFSEVK